MKLKSEKFAKVFGGAGGVEVALRPVSGLPGILIGQHGDLWVIATRDGKSKVFPTKRDANNFLFCLELTRDLESLGKDTSSMNNRLMGFLDQPCRFAGAQ